MQIPCFLSSMIFWISARYAAPSLPFDTFFFFFFLIFLPFFQIEAGKLDLEDTVFNIVETVEEVVSSVSPQACEKGIELIAVVDPQIPRYLHGDSRRLRQVLLNFLRYQKKEKGGRERERE